MRTFKVHFTHWDDELKIFIKEEVQFDIKNNAFDIMFTELTRKFNVMCSENFYDLSWIDSVSEVNAA